jgi:hypothetical protein
MRWLRDWLGRLFVSWAERTGPGLRFSLRRPLLEGFLSFYVSDAMFADMRDLAGDRDVSRLVRSSVALGLGLYGERPELMAYFDRRAAQQRHVTCCCSATLSDRVVRVAQGQQSRFLRASVEFGLLVFRAHPGLLSSLDERQPE